MDELLFKSREQITRGWSEDAKYQVTLMDGITYFLKISSIDQYDRKKAGFELLQEVATLGIPMSRPIAFGVCSEGVYTLQSWIEGLDGEDIIPLRTASELAALGMEAGQILKKIHSLRAPKSLEDWESQFTSKIDRNISNYLKSPIQYEGGQVFIEYINANRHLLKGRPQCYQHGDYHIGNMMMDRTGKLQIIDFERYDFGDPWEEFNRIVWCAQKSPHFASGLIDGYFDHNVPVDFWPLLALYIASNALSSIYWAISFGPTEINKMLTQAKEILTWFDQMKTPVPIWWNLT